MLRACKPPRLDTAAIAWQENDILHSVSTIAMAAEYVFGSLLTSTGSMIDSAYCSQFKRSFLRKQENCFLPNSPGNGPLGCATSLSGHRTNLTWHISSSAGVRIETSVNFRCGNLLQTPALPSRATKIRHAAKHRGAEKAIRTLSSSFFRNFVAHVPFSSTTCYG